MLVSENSNTVCPEFQGQPEAVACCDQCKRPGSREANLLRLGIRSMCGEMG